MKWFFNLWFGGPGMMDEKVISIGLLELTLKAKWKTRGKGRFNE